YDEGQDDPEVRRHVDALVEQFAEGIEDEDEGSQDNFQPSSNCAADEEVCVEKQKVTPSRVGEAVVSQSAPGTDNP
ncbi:hypothetical protein A2U01_0101250, partial [Trifolium medium]|nr:hypothetical protein [Trifolium medium]